MSRRMMAIGLAVLAAGPAVAADAVLDGPAGSVTVLSGPDPLYEPVATVADGTPVTRLGGGMTTDADSNVTMIDSTHGWTLVRLPSGATGWVPNALLASPQSYRAAADAAPAAAPGLEVEEVTQYTSVVWPEAGRLNLRAGPGTRFDVVQTMERGDWVAVTAKAGPWARIRHESGAEGWAFHGYLTR